MRNPARMLAVTLGSVVGILFLACGLFVFSESIREGLHDASWSAWRKFFALLLYIATGLIIAERTASNVTKKFNIAGDAQFAILLAYLLALTIWGVLCFLPIYLLLGRD